jgi:hypothetical protein
LLLSGCKGRLHIFDKDRSIIILNWDKFLHLIPSLDGHSYYLVALSERLQYLREGNDLAAAVDDGANENEVKVI